METTTATVLTDAVRFPEDPRWHDGELWFCDFFAQRVMRVDMAGHVNTVIETPDIPTGLDWTPDGRCLIVSGSARKLVQFEASTLVDVADMSALVTHPCNELVIDKQGRAYVANIGFDFGNPDEAPQLAPIMLISPNGDARIAADGLAFPNGMVITPDGRTLIVAESYAARLTAFTIEPDGSLTNRRTWAQFEDCGNFSEGQITPDGICMDAEGAVWLASPNGKQVLRVREGGQITDRFSLSTIPLACMLGGTDRRTLFIATTESLNPADTGAKGRIEMLRVAVPGTGMP